MGTYALQQFAHTLQPPAVAGLHSFDAAGHWAVTQESRTRLRRECTCGMELRRFRLKETLTNVTATHALQHLSQVLQPPVAAD